MRIFHFAYEKTNEDLTGAYLSGKNIPAPHNDFELATAKFKETFWSKGEEVPPIIYVHQHFEHIDIQKS
jgi:hypothetical protein